MAVIGKVNKKSVTLIEMIAVIIVLSLAIPTLLMLFSQANLRTVQTETIFTANFYSEELMEEMRLKKFDENDSPPWSSSLGPDSGETTRTDYDDVDDFNGYSDNPDSPSTRYNRSVSVEYAELNGTTWQTATSPPTDYKRITVTVSRTEGGIAPISLVVLVGGY